MRALALATAFAMAVPLIGCGGATSQATISKQPTVDERKAAKDAKALVREIYQTISRSTNTDGLMALLAEPLVVFGPRLTDGHASRSDALVAMRTLLDERGKANKPQVSSGGLAVVASPGGLSAWAVDVLEVEGSPMALTAVLSNEDDFWVIAAAALARTPSMKTVRSSLKTDAIVPPALAAPAKISRAAEGAADRFKRGLADPEEWGADLAARSEAVVIGPSAGDMTRGKKEIAKLWKKRGKANTRYATAGDVAAGATQDGQLAWVTVPAVQFAEDDEPLPLRIFGIYERVGDGWKLIALQESLAVDEPGVGANFKKITPPAVKAEAPPPAPPPKEPKKKKKKKKKATTED
jgi:hypothetical protein